MGAGLLLRSYLQLQSIDRGFQADHLLTVRLSLPSNGSSDSETIGLYQRILDRIETLPGVQGVAATTNVPLDGQQAVGMRFAVDGGQTVPRSERPAAVTQLINPGFLQTMGIPIRQGRPFTPQDRASSPLVAIVSESLARRYWPGGSPIGRYLIVNSPSARAPQSDLRREVVGVAADIVYPTRKAQESVEIYLPYLQNMWPNVFLFIRTHTEPASLISAVRRIVSEIDPQQSISRVQTMEERIAKINGKPRWNTVVLGLFALLAVALAGVGIYGVIAYSVSQRTQEIGVRMALGAKPSDIVRLILKTGVWTASAGLALGLTGCYFLSRLLATLIFGISSHDPLTLGAASVLLALVALLASYLPARRATKLDPVTALREQ